MRIIVHPSRAPDVALDITQALIATVARELSRVQGGPSEWNWDEASQLVEHMTSRNEFGPCEPRQRDAARREIMPEAHTEPRPVYFGRAHIPAGMDVGAFDLAHHEFD